MQIETYEIEGASNQDELNQLVHDGEFSMLVDELELEGQQFLIGNDQNENSDVFPYRKMTSQERIVYETLFPEKTNITHYKDGIIPIRVLQVYQHALSFNRDDCCKFFVWHPKNADKDPILVGGKDYYYSDQYILARWGDALTPFDELMEKAIKILTENYKVDMLNFKSQVETRINILETYVKSRVLSGKDINIPRLE